MNLYTTIYYNGMVYCVELPIHHRLYVMRNGKPCWCGNSHEIVRHRLFSFAQESTRYVNYGGKDIEFILPCWFSEESQEILLNIESVDNDNILRDNIKLGEYIEYLWFRAMLDAEEYYHILIERGWTPQQARGVLPNSLKTEIVITGNLRQWRHFFKLRTATDAHVQMREVANMALEMLRSQIPVIFDDIGG